MGPTGIPFNDIRALATMLPPPDGEAMAAVTARTARLAKPVGDLGRLAEIAIWLAGWQGRPMPEVTRPLVAVFAAAHGVAGHNIAAIPSAAGPAQLADLAAGGGAINALCASSDIGLKMFELALEVPTRDFTVEAALDERDCAATMAFGMEALAGGTDLLCLGEIGIGNKVAAAAMAMALFGGATADWIGPPEGADAALRARQAAVIDQALGLHGPFLADPLEVLRRLGGREIAAAAGAILAARLQRIPVILDGFAITAAAAVLHRLAPDALDHCLAGHVSAEPGHRRLLARLGKPPLLDLGMDLGQGTGAALAAGIVRAAAACHRDMAEGETQTLN